MLTLTLILALALHTREALPQTSILSRMTVDAEVIVANEAGSSLEL